MNAFHRDHAHMFRFLGALLLLTLALIKTALGQTPATDPNAQAVPQSLPNPAKSEAQRPASHIELLTDPGGADFHPYLSRIAPSIRSHWVELVPDGSLIRKQSGRLTIEFTIQKDGQLGQTKLISSSGETLLDRAAMAGITSAAPFPPLPPEFSGKFIELRMGFAYRSWLDLNSPSESTTDPQPEANTAGTETIYKVGHGVTAPQQIYAPNPEFSEQARRAKYEGNVTLKTIVSSSGDVISVKLINGAGMGLDEKAMEAVRRWKFKPATKDGKPVAVEIAIAVSFSVQK